MKDRLKGLTSKEVEASRAKYGDNSLKRERGKSFVTRFFENLSDPIIKVLVIALAIEVIFTFGNCNFFEVFGILAAILISTTVSTVSEYGSERAFRRMEADSLTGTVNVIRDGKTTEIAVADIVVGDVMLVGAGECINADARILSGELTVDQSALNGESIEVSKTASAIDNGEGLSSPRQVFRGSLVTSGSAVLSVERVGGATFYGGVASDVQKETRESPLKRRLSRLASDISKIGYVMAVLVGISYLFNTYVVSAGFNGRYIIELLSDTKSLFGNLLHTLTLMITVIVVAVPEGLPMMITVVLSANMRRMLSDKVLVKKLVGIETAGSLNILFTDKTGTITEGRFSCEEIITPNGRYRSVRALKNEKNSYELLAITGRYNTDSRMENGEIIGGNATDRALFSFFAAESVSAEVIAREPFDSSKKYSSVTLKNGIKLIKGAAEFILSRSKYIYAAGGERVLYDFSLIERDYIAAVSRGERVIAVATEEAGGVYTFVALVVLKDKIRRGVREAVSEVSAAGIQTVMLTGDSRETAISIASECGILKDRTTRSVLTSDELSRMDDAELSRMLPELRVLARALPKDKSRLVRVSQEAGLVVGMTGDGVNDAPSLKLADVGFAMGSGTDIAKGAGDIVILDNRFLAISKSILYGRTIFKSIRKFITFQLIMNLAACGISLLGQFLGIENPITVTQMLWVNIIMDTLGGLAFAGEAPLAYYMREKPKRRDERILTRDMISHVLTLGAYVLALCTIFLTSTRLGDLYRGEAELLTAFYALFIFAGIFTSFAARCERLWIFSNILKNVGFIVIMLLISAVQLAMIYFGGAVFRCVPLTPRELLTAIALAATVIPFDGVRRIFLKLK